MPGAGSGVAQPHDHRPDRRPDRACLRNPAAGAWHVARKRARRRDVRSPSRTRSRPRPTRAGAGAGAARCASLFAPQRPGMAVTFAELSGSVLHASGAPAARVARSRSRPATAAGNRQIVALIDQDGIPGQRVTPSPASAHGPAASGERCRLARRGPRSRADDRLRRGKRRAGTGSASARTDGQQRLLLATATHRAARVTDLGPARRRPSRSPP